MTKPGGGIESKIEPSMIARAIQGMKYAFTGNADWFGPGVPQTPTAPVEITGRQFDLPISMNTVVSTKTDGITFHTLRQFADSCDIVRLLIETRKDQVCGLSWSIKPKGEKGTTKPLPGEKVATDPRIDDVTAFLSKPDKDHSWSEWLRLLLEDMFVIDAPAIYLQKTNGGDVYALRPIDGSTVKRIIDTHGWTPMPPRPAYQQILKGTTALSYTRDEMIYKPRNPRTNRIYGYGPVEQIVVTIKLFLVRQASNLEYYETGNMPEGFLSGPAGWTPQQLKEFQDIFDAMMSGNLAERRKVRMVPNDSKYVAAKEPALKNEYDEWLARIACFAFSYPPTPFIKQMNRATGETAKESADEEGIQPITRWVKELIDEIVQVRLGMPDLEFTFEDKEAQDPLERAQIDDIKIKNGSLTVDEARADDGREPLPKPTPEELAAKAAAAGGNPAVPPPKGEEPPDPESAQKLRKADKTPPPPIDRQRAVIVTTRTNLAKDMEAALQLASEEAAAQVTAAVDAGLTDAGVQLVVDQLSLEGLTEASSSIQQSLQAVAVDGTNQALLQLNVGTPDMTNLVNEQAVAWAEKRSASLITSSGTGGELLDATRDLIRGTVEKAVSEGWSNAKLAKELRESYAFSSQRAMTIARTELAFADAQGNLISYINSGVVKRKQWLEDADACVVCRGNAAQGEIPLLTSFASGDMTAPAHPNCECDVAPIVD